jgi:putative ABC transport system permease protein
MLTGELFLATKNLFGNKVRTSLAISSIVFSMVAQLLSAGFIEWIFWAARESVIESRLGHIQVVRSGYYELGSANPFEYLLPAEASLMGEIKALPNVVSLVQRLNFNGLISFGEITLSFQGEGVQVEPSISSNTVKQAQISKRREIHGNRQLVTLQISEGEGLSQDDRHGIIIGAGLAANLGVKPGDSVVMLANTSAGGLNAVEARINGIFFTSSKQFDDYAVRVPLSLAQELLRTSSAHLWVIMLSDTSLTDSTVSMLGEALDQSKSGLEVVPWYQLADFYNKTVVLFSRQVDVMRVIIGMLILLSISNVLIMSVMDRTSEIGTLMALGIKRRSILSVFLWEAVLMGGLGVLMGVLLGGVLARIISEIGIPMPPTPGANFEFRAEILLTWRSIATAIVVSLITTLFAALYPAWKASRLVIVDALRIAR